MNRDERRAEKAQQRASRLAQRDRMNAARAAEREAMKLDRQAKQSRRRADLAAGLDVEPSTAQKIAVSGGRVVIGVAGIATTIAVLGGVAFVQWPSWGVAAPAVTVNPTAAEQQRVCPGPFLTVGAESTAANTVSSLGRPSTASTGGTPTKLSSDNARADRDGTALGYAAAADAPPLAASQIELLSGESASGLTAASCSAPGADMWLVGGSSTVGYTSVVTIANPTEITANVRIEIFGASGPIATDAKGFVVPAGHQVSLPLAGLAPDEAAPVVHITSEGGHITAALSVSQIDGLTPVGADIVGPSALPATSAVIPGVAVDASVTTAERGEGADLAPTLRLLAPSSDAQVEIAVIGENGTPGATLEASVSAGTVVDVPVTGLMPGNYSFVLTSTAAIVASAESAVTAAEGTDFAWFASASTLTDSTGLAVPSGVAATIHLVNTTQSDAEVSLASGERIRVAAGAAVSVPLNLVKSQMDGTRGLYAAVSLSTAGRLAGFALPGVLIDSSSVSVFTR